MQYKLVCSFAVVNQQNLQMCVPSIKCTFKQEKTAPLLSSVKAFKMVH